MKSLLLHIYSRPGSVITILTVMTACGIGALFHIDYSLAPKHDPGQMKINLRFEENASEVDRNVLVPLREKLEALPGLNEVSYRRSDTDATLFLSLVPGAAVEEIRFLVQDEINQFSVPFPFVDFGLPEIADAYNLPLIRIYLYPSEGSNIPNIHQLSTLARKWLIPRLMQVEGTGEVKLSGQAEYQKLIEPDIMRMNIYGYTSRDIKMSLENCFGEQLIEYSDGSRSLISVPAARLDPAACFLTNDHTLSAVCQFRDTLLYPQGKYFIDEKPAIAVDVYPVYDVSVLKVAAELKELLSSMQDSNTGISFRIALDQDNLILSNIWQLFYSLCIVIAVNIVVVYFFSGELKRTLLIAATIPVTLVLSVLFLWLLNISVHIFVLGGIILGIGLVIDTPIVITEAIKHDARGEQAPISVIRKLQNVSVPVIMSAVTTILAFIPVIFLSERTRQLFFDQFLTLSIMVGVSLVLGLTVLPVYYFAGIGMHKKSRFSVANLYERWLNYFLVRPGLTIFGLILLFAASIFGVKTMEFSILPQMSFRNWQLEQPVSPEEDIPFSEYSKYTVAVKKTPDSEIVYLTFDKPRNLTDHGVPGKAQFFASPNPILTLFPSYINSTDLRLYPQHEEQWRLLAREGYVEPDTIWKVKPKTLQWHMAGIVNPNGESFKINNMSVTYNDPGGRLWSRMGLLFPDRVASVRPEIQYGEVWKDRYGTFVPVRTESSLIERIRQRGIPLRRIYTSNEFEVLNAQVRWAVFAVTLIIYIMLALQFSSWTWPFLVMVSIPISISGSLLCLWVTNTGINVISIVGIVVTLGISVNDAILKVTSVRSLLRKGIAPIKAIKTASQERFNPVVMTSLTTLAACLPMFWFHGGGSEIQLALGITVIGGLGASTLGALFAIPAMLSLTRRFT
ncbi:MAG: efflux RND transporter permease subunit [Cyclobacteriaceae bacterium]